MRTDFFVASPAKPEGERLVILHPAEIPASFFFASSIEKRCGRVSSLVSDHPANSSVLH